MSKNKIGILTGLLVAIVLISYQSFLTETEARVDLFSPRGFLMFLSTIAGSVFSGFVIQKYIVGKFILKGSVIGCIAASIAISPLSFYYSTIFGTLGGGLGALLFRIFGIEEVGIYVGILLAITFVFIVIECFGALIGTFLGFVFEIIFRTITNLLKK
jgi:hypothetical protein